VPPSPAAETCSGGAAVGDVAGSHWSGWRAATAAGVASCDAGDPDPEADPAGRSAPRHMFSCPVAPALICAEFGALFASNLSQKNVRFIKQISHMIIQLFRLG
jgi:hypothetical protein